MSANSLATNEDFGIDAYNGELRHAVKQANEWLSRPHARWITFCGPSGTGKTHLAKALYRLYRCRMVKTPDSYSGMGMREERERKQFFRWLDILGHMRGGDFGVIDYVVDLSLAVIDDIGAGYESELGRAKLYEVAERRIGRPTIWTANLSVEQIGDMIDMRLASRLLRHGSVVVEFSETEDWELVRRS